MEPKPTHHLHLVSDATGDTIQSVARACLAQFDEIEPVEHFWNLVRTQRQLDLVIADIEAHPGLVLYTLVDQPLRQRLTDACREAGLPCISVLDPILGALGPFFGRPGRFQPGRQHLMDDAYFHRMDAMDFALAHDDGHLVDRLHEADVVLVGVSRTSKTPTCLYLANRGIRAANVPLIPGIPPPAALGTLTRTLVVGLTKAPDQLVQIRRNRIEMLHQSAVTDYVDPEAVRQEVQEARRMFARRGWPVIDVSRRAIEETAAEIVGLLSRAHAKANAR